MSGQSIDINELRSASRQLLREWGILKLQSQGRLPASHAHALLEINDRPRTVTQLSEILILDVSTTSRLVDKLSKEGFVVVLASDDKRSKLLALTAKGQQEVQRINQFSNKLIDDAFDFLSVEQQQQILQSVSMYANALSKGRLLIEDVQIRTLKKDKLLRNKIVDMIYAIQTGEFDEAVERSVNGCVLNAEAVYYHKGKCNFWYALDKCNRIIGTIGLKAIDANNAELKKCFVAKEHRGKGLAQKLVMKVIRQARKLEFENIYLGTVGDFVWAHRFYSKFGFKKIDSSQLPDNFERCPVDSVFFCGLVKHLGIAKK